jgi:hypothetical protein
VTSLSLRKGLTDRVHFVPALAESARRISPRAACQLSRCGSGREYAWDIDRPSYFLGERFLVRRAPDEADGEDWYGCKDGVGAGVLTSLGLPTQIR